jgi:putative toxin-antitoxin system antitoxin component (TIGR02293 family)
MSQGPHPNIRSLRVSEILQRCENTRDPATRIGRILTGKRDHASCNPEAIIEQVRRGLAIDVVTRLVAHFGYPLRDILDVLALSPRSYAYRKAKRRRLTPAQSDRAYRLARVGIHAENVFDDQGIAHAWLQSHNRALGATPLALLDTQPGIDQVEIILGRIETGVYS